MQDDYEKYLEKYCKRSRLNIVHQKCVLFDPYEDEEYSDEFFLLEPIAINDMYNQN